MKKKRTEKIFFSGFRKILILVLVGVFAFGLTGCSSSKNKSSSSGSVTLYWWRSQEDASKETLETIASKYEENNPGVNIEIVLKNPATYLKDATEALAASQTVEGAPDILSINAEDMPKMALQLTSAPDNLFAEKDDTSSTGVVKAVKESFVDAASKAVTLNDPTTGQASVFGLPIAIDSLVLYRNTDMLNEAATNLKAENKTGQQYSADEIKILKKKIQSAPATWSDLVEIIPFIKVQSGNDIAKAAISLGTSTNTERAYDILQTIMMQNGTEFVSSGLDSATFNQSKPGAATSTNPGEKALNFYLRFSNPNDPVYTWNNNMPNSFDAFKNGQSAMMIHYSSAYNILINEAKSLKGKIDIQALPQAVNPKATTSTNQIKTMAKMWVETAPSTKGDAKRQVAAWKFIKFVSAGKGSAAYLSATKMASALKEGTDRTKFDALSTQKNAADILFKGTDSQAVNQTFIAMIDDVVSGKKTSQDALNSGASEVTKIFGQSKVKWSTASGSVNTNSDE